jgi:hypothetical protein
MTTLFSILLVSRKGGAADAGALHPTKVAVPRVLSLLLITITHGSPFSLLLRK